MIFPMGIIGWEGDLNLNIPINSATNQVTRAKYKGLSSIDIYPENKYLNISDKGEGGGGAFKIKDITTYNGCTTYNAESQLSVVSISLCGKKGTLKYLTNNITIDFSY